MFQKGVKPVIKHCQLSLYQECSNLYDLLYLIAEDSPRSKLKKGIRKKNPVTQLLVKTIMWTDPLVIPDSDSTNPLPLPQGNIWFKKTALREKNWADKKKESNAWFSLLSQKTGDKRVWWEKKKVKIRRKNGPHLEAAV